MSTRVRRLVTITEGKEGNLGGIQNNVQDIYNSTNMYYSLLVNQHIYFTYTNTYAMKYLIK